MSKKFVIIMTDTQRWDMMSCARDTGLKTPCLDKMASQGVRFDRAYTTQPVCQPARAGIFTGQYPHSVGSWTNSYGISDTAHHIGERLALDGIHTAYVGKWHLDGGDYFGSGKCPKGFDPDYWYDMKCYLDELTEEERVISRDHSSMHRMDHDETFCYGHRVSNRAIDFLQNHHEEDFLLVVSYDEPHGPYLCPQPYASMYQDYQFPRSKNRDDSMENKPEHQRVWGQKAMQADPNAPVIDHEFFGCNSYVDYEIGRVLDQIEAVAPDAMVLYTSDHGDMLHSHHLNSKGPCAYDEITRIPFIVKGPNVPAGVVNENPMSHINIVPSVLEYMNAFIPSTVEGKSALAEWMDPQNVVTNDKVFFEFGRYEVDHDGFGAYQPLRSVYDGRYKLTINLMTTDELYDMVADPEELNNLILDPAHQEIRDHLHDAILGNMNLTRDPFRGYYWEQRPWRTDACTSTWSYTGYTRQRDEDPRFESRQLDYDTGLPIVETTRFKKV